MVALAISVVLVAAIRAAAALDNGLGRLPGLGWNSDYCNNCHKSDGFQNEAYIRQLALFFNKSGLAALGYTHINLDASWDIATRDAQGNLQPDPAQWPSGIEATIDYVHGLGLKFGLYGDRGTKDCAGNPGNQGFEKQDAAFYARLNADWYKQDSCYAPQDVPSAIAQYALMRDALNATGRPIWFALCGWHTWFANQSLGNSWRVGPDTVCGWPCVMENVLAAVSVANRTGPTAHGGGWNDLCLLLSLNFSSGVGLMTEARQRSQFNLWCVNGANMLMTGNMSSIDPYTYATWTNAEAIGINQDPLGAPVIALVDYNISFSQDAQGHLRNVTINGVAYEDATVAECGGEPSLQQWEFNKPMAEFVFNAATNKCLNVAECKTEVIYDGCTTTGGTCAGKGQYNNEQFVYVNNTLQSALATGPKCIGITSNNTLTRQDCDGGTHQYWIYDDVQKQLRTKDGMCLTAKSDTPNPSLVLGRPLHDGGWGVVFLNNNYDPANMTCDAACFSRMPSLGKGKVVIRDLWQHATVATVDAGQGWTVPVVGGGGSVFVKMLAA